MGSVLQRILRQGSDGAGSSSFITNSVSLSSSSRQQENQSTSRAENASQGYHGICASSPVQSSAQEGLSLSPEQRARMEYHKSMALARRKEKLKQQSQDEEVLLNRLTPVQRTPSSHVQSTLSSQQAETHLRTTPPLHQTDYGGTTTYSSSPLQREIYQGSWGVTRTHSAQDIYGVPTLATTHSVRYLQHGFSDLHQNMYGSAQSSQEGRHTTLSSVQSSAPLQQNHQGSLAPTFVQNYLSSLQGSHSSLALESVHSPLTLQQQIDGHSGSAGSSSHGSFASQHDGCVGSSLTLEQRARMACEREKALAKLKGRQKQEHCLNETGTSQCTIADGLNIFLSQKNYQHGDPSHVPVELSFSIQKEEDNGSFLTPVQIAYIAQEEEAAIARRKKGQQDAQPTAWQYSGERIIETQKFGTETFSQHSQDSCRGPPSNYVQNSQHSALSLTSVQSVASSQQVTCSGSSLTPEQRARMAHQKEMAILRRNARFQQQQQDEHHTHLTYAKCLASSQQDTHCGSSLTQEQRARMAYQKELAIVKRNVRFQQQQQQQDEHNHTQLACAQSLALSQQDDYSGSSLTQEHRTRMARQKEMAIARRNVRLQQQQQDERHHMHHKPPNSKQGTDLESQEFATSLLMNCVVDCSQSGSNEREVSQAGDISLSLHQQIFSLPDSHDRSAFSLLQSNSTLQQNEDNGFSFTPVERSLSSQEDSSRASFLALTQNDHLASSREAFSSCSQNCTSILSMGHAVKCSQSLALHQPGAPVLSQQVVSLDEGNMDNSSLTPQQKARMASQKERALAKRKMVLEQQRLQPHHVNKPSGIQVGCSQVSSPCSPIPRSGSWEYFSAECCDSLASECYCIVSQESQHIQRK